MNEKLITTMLTIGFPIVSSSNQFLSKLSIEKKNYVYLLLSLCGYLFYGLMNYKLLQYKNITTSNIIQYGSHIIIGIFFMFVGKFYFKETYSKQEYAGILFGIVSMFLLVFSKNIEH